MQADCRVRRILAEVSALLEELGQLSTPSTCQVHDRGASMLSTDGFACDARTLCRDLYRIRRIRDSVLDDNLFNDHAWDMMLDLYQAELDGAGVTVVSLCAAAQMPQTSGLRVIGALIKCGLLQKRVDAVDRRRSFVTLTVKGHKAMAEFVGRIVGHSNVERGTA